MNFTLHLLVLFGHELGKALITGEVKNQVALVHFRIFIECHKLVNKLALQFLQDLCFVLSCLVLVNV